MNVRYLETDETDEGPIRWYSIDDETYGVDAEGVILDDGGCPIADGPESRTVLREIAKYEASK